MMNKTVWIHADAPAKPAVGATCNGCGVCCLAEPCPVGMLLSRRRRGACVALRWDDADRRYLCGVVAQPQAVLRWLPRFAAKGVARWARRVISAGSGCDAALDVQRPQP